LPVAATLPAVWHSLYVRMHANATVWSMQSPPPPLRKCSPSWGRYRSDGDPVLTGSHHSVYFGTGSELN